jgi:hypothetical protein
MHRPVSASGLAVACLLTLAAASRAGTPGGFFDGDGGAAPATPTPAAPWESVEAKLLEQGTYSEAYAPLPPTYGLQSIQGPKDASHRADYANLWGTKDAGGAFRVESASLESEDWTLEAGGGRWSFDQWLFSLKPDGSISGVTHRTIVEKVDDGVAVSITNDPQIASDPAGFRAKARVKYDALLRFWNAYRPRD